MTGLAGGLPADQKAVTIGYDSSNPDNQLISNLIQTQLAAAGLTAKVQAYPTSEIYGWVGSDGQSAPEIMAYLGWPDAPSQAESAAMLEPIGRNFIPDRYR